MRTCRSVLLATIFLLADRASAVIPISADAVIQPGHYFDLEGTTLHFKPERRGYSVSSSPAKPVAAAPGELLGKADYQFIRSWGYRKALPFPFSFGGKVWREVFINGAGNLSFGRPEAELYPERDTWPAGTMQSVAGSINDRASAGQELIICGLWAINAPQEEKTQIYFRQSAKEHLRCSEKRQQSSVGQALSPGAFACLAANGYLTAVGRRTVCPTDLPRFMVYGWPPGMGGSSAFIGGSILFRVPRSRCQSLPLSLLVRGKIMVIRFQVL